MKKQVSSGAPKNISVFLRVRPPVPREATSTCDNLTLDPAEPTKVTVSRKTGAKPGAKSYYFNKIFPPKAGQAEVYETFARSAVDAAFDGQHGVLFVYGQTGSGKSYTVSNEDPLHPGVLQQCLREAWARMAEDKEHDYSCSMSYVQLYNEILTDLLDAQKGRVRIQLGPEGRGDVILVAEESGLSIEKKVENYDETMGYFRTGMKRKEMTSTQMNDNSSRSHTIFNFNITRSKKVRRVTVSEEAGMQMPSIALEGRLVICDLAGSERIKKTKAEGKTLEEATHINGSLLVLGKVVAALTEKNSQHTPFRESKLTRILQYSLLGNGNTSIVVNVSPADVSTEETIGAILFGQRAIQIKQDAKRHEVLDYKTLYLQLLAELDSKNDGTLEDALSEERVVYEEKIRALEDRVKFLTAENELLRKESAGQQSGTSVLSRSGGASDDWQTMSKTLREKVVERDRRIATLSEEHTKLAILLAQEKRTAYLLAMKFRATMIQNQMDRQELSQRVDELNTELARTKGVEYIGLLSGVNNDDSGAARAALESPTAHVDPMALKLAGNGDAYMQEQLDKSYQRIRALHQDCTELRIYQFKAEKAIRMLYAEKEALLRKASQAS